MKIACSPNTPSSASHYFKAKKCYYINRLNENDKHCIYLVGYFFEQLLSHPWVRGEKAKDDQMDPEIVDRLQKFNARRKLRAAAIASLYSSTVFLRIKNLKSLLGSYDLKQEEIESLKIHFKKM